jgi:hypothetical protein
MRTRQSGVTAERLSVALVEHPASEVRGGPAPVRDA